MKTLFILNENSIITVIEMFPVPILHVNPYTVFQPSLKIGSVFMRLIIYTRAGIKQMNRIIMKILDELLYSFEFNVNTDLDERGLFICFIDPTEAKIETWINKFALLLSEWYELIPSGQNREPFQPFLRLKKPNKNNPNIIEFGLFLDMNREQNIAIAIDKEDFYGSSYFIEDRRNRYREYLSN